MVLTLDKRAADGKEMERNVCIYRICLVLVLLMLSKRENVVLGVSESLQVGCTALLQHDGRPTH